MKTNSPANEAIAQRAHEIWSSEGNPHGSDVAHWLEAERQLTAVLPAAEPAHATSAPRPSPDDLAAKATFQKQAARSPQLQHGKNAPKSPPAESGKPLWDKPHSS